MLILARARRTPRATTEEAGRAVHRNEAVVLRSATSRTRRAKGSTIASCRHFDIAITQTFEELSYDVGRQSSHDRERLTFRSQCRNMCGLCARQHGPRFSESATTSVAFVNDGVVE